MAWTTPRTWAANELVTATLLNAHLRDNLNALKSPPSDNIVTVASAFSTSSTSFVTITDAEAECTTAGGRLLISAFGTLTSNAGLTAMLSLLIDDTDRQGSATQGLQSVYVVVSPSPFCIVYMTPALSAANHTVKLQIKVNTNVVSVPQWVLWIQET